MPDWVVVGQNILNVNNIEFVERVSATQLIVYMTSGKKIELTNTAAITLWLYLDSERLKFLDLGEPTRDFSGT